ncbi:hypothetical protein DL767_009880 [Monosporascus sp. MG133]|nr:hypothetical protein DL767_009880 [Monosporascus sp. MG133]
MQYLKVVIFGAMVTVGMANVEADEHASTICSCATVTETATPITGLPTNPGIIPPTLPSTVTSGVPIPTIGTSTLVVSISTPSTSVGVPGTSSGYGNTDTGSGSVVVPTETGPSDTATGTPTGTGTATGTETGSTVTTGPPTTGHSHTHTPTASGSGTVTGPSTSEAPSTSQAAAALPTGSFGFTCLWGGAALVAMVNI